MLSPKLRSKIYDLWTKFWSAGMTNPLTAIEQITYLIFLKQLETLDAERIERGERSIYSSRDTASKKCSLTPEQHHADDHYDVQNNECHGHATCKWSYIKTKKDPDHLRNIVFPWLRQFETTLEILNEIAPELQTPAQYLDDAFFQLPREKIKTLGNAIDTIEELFRDVGSRSANADLMGDIFEYMLGEIQTSGKNGQFRTPRHIIRFMIDLLDPELDSRILDPAAGTSGFLINCVQHLKLKLKPDVLLVTEWDGTPHRLPSPTESENSQYFTGDHFVAYDNDRTMVRIGWMNMILHGIENPTVERRDALSKSVPDSESGRYDYIFANPPYSGNVDQGDIHETRIPRHAIKKDRDTGELTSITDRTELLFVWLMLDLLAKPTAKKRGGQAAVIVPEGVLFGSTLAHRELRRQLLFENKLHAVISLPAGMFEPYSGVKTAILFFERGNIEPNPKTPLTEQVWFYEIAADGFTLDKKRTAQPKPNDLWDARYKWQHRDAVPKSYYQPELTTVRWRLIDADAIRVFGEEWGEERTKEIQGQVLGIDERFPDSGLTADPEKATEIVAERQTLIMTQLYSAYVGSVRAEAEEAASNARGNKRTAIKKVFKERKNKLDRLFDHYTKPIETENVAFLEPEYGHEGGYGLNLFKKCQTLAQGKLDEVLTQWVSNISNGEPLPNIGKPDLDDDAWEAAVQDSLRDFARLDGYDVQLCATEPLLQAEPVTEPKAWVAPVRQWLRDDEWKNEDGEIVGSHDEAGSLRADYFEAMVNEEGIANEDALEPDCIEANDLNLSAGRYKPFDLQIVDYEPPAKLILSIQKLESEIQTNLVELLTMVDST